MKKLTIALALTAAVCCSAAENLIKNSDFQEVGKNGKLTGWRYSAEFKTEESGDAKVISVQVTAPEEGAKKTRASVSLSQKIQLPEAGKLQLTLVGKIDGTGMINCTWRFLDESGEKIPVKKNWCKGIKGGKDEWQTVEQVVEVPEGAKSMTLFVTCSADRKRKQEGGTMYIKQISLTPVEE